jgi:hypothetical protein
MSTPMVAGAVALLLQAYPQLNSEQIIRILASSARKDGFTGPLISPNGDWGSGKLDIEAAIREAAVLSGQAPLLPNQKLLHLYPNPSHQSVKLKLPIEGGKNLRVINSFGVEVYRYDFLDSDHEINLSHWPRGIYQVLIKVPGHKETTKMVVD